MRDSEGDGMDYPTKEKLLSSIQIGMKLDKEFFRKIYGYEITWPGFKEIAIKKMQTFGYDDAQKLYDEVVSEHENKSCQSLKETAVWLSKKINSDYEKHCMVKEGSEDLRQKLLIQRKMYLMQLKEKLQKSKLN